MSLDGQMEIPQDSSSQSSDGKCKNPLKAYAKLDANPPERYFGCIPVLVDVMALSGMTEQHPRMPVDLVIVFHVHRDCSVPKNWEKLLMNALEIVVKTFHRHDRVAVVPIQPFFKNVQDFTMLCSNVLSKSDTSLVRALKSAESILYRRERKDKEMRGGHILVISNSKDGLDSLLGWRFPSVDAFGFRDAHNARAMHAISINNGCTYATLDDEHGQVTQAFIACINRITSTITPKHIEVKLKCEGEHVFLFGIDTPGINYLISNDRKGGIIWFSAHLAGMPTRNFIVYVNVSVIKYLPMLLTIDVKCDNVSKKFDMLLVSKGIDGSKEVAAEMVRIEAVKIVADMVAKDKNDMAQLHGAAYDLHKRWTELLKHSDHGMEAAEGGLISRLTMDMQEMEIRLYNNYFWLEYMLSWQSHQRWQLPLPQLFMDNDPRMRARVLAKVDGLPGAITDDNQKGLPVLVQLMAPESMLATVKRAPVDLIVVLDATYGPSEIERKKQKRLEILMRDMEIVEQHNEVKKMEKKLKKKMEPLNKAKEEKERKIRVINERLNLPAKAKEFLDKKCKTCRLANGMAEKLKGKLEEKLEKKLEPKLQLLDEALKDEEHKWKEVNKKIKHKRLEMNRLLEEKEKLHKHAERVEEELAKVMEDTHKRLEILIKAMELVMMKLGDKDHLAIVPVQSSVNNLATGLLDMSKQGRSETYTKVHSFLDLIIDRTLMAKLGNGKATQNWSEEQKKDIRAATLQIPKPSKSEGTTSMMSHSADVDGSTKMRKALMDAVKTWSEEQKKDIGAATLQIPKPSESESTSSMMSHSADVDGSTKMRKALMDAVKILDDRQGKEKERLGFVIVISDSDDESICLESLSTNYTMHAFGFSDTHNSRAMYHVSNSGNGIYDILNDGHNQITAAFRVCIEKITSTIAVDTEVKMMCSHSSSVMLSNIESGQFRHFIDHDGKYSSIFVGALYAGAVRNFISYVDNVREDNHDSFAKLFTVHVKWLHALSRVENKLEGQVVTFKNGSDESKEVEENIAYVEIVKIVSSITDPNYNKKAVADNLQKMYEKCLKDAGDAGEDFLTRDMMKIKRNLLTDNPWYILSWLSYHRKSEQAPLPQPVA